MKKGTHTEQDPRCRRRLSFPPPPVFDCCPLPPRSSPPDLRSLSRRLQQDRPPSYFWFAFYSLSSASSWLQFCQFVYLPTPLRWTESVAACQASEVQTSRAACCVPALSQTAGVDHSRPQTCGGNVITYTPWSEKFKAGRSFQIQTCGWWILSSSVVPRPPWSPAGLHTWHEGITPAADFKMANNQTWYFVNHFK